MGRNVKGKVDERAVPRALKSVRTEGLGTQCVRRPKDRSALIIIDPRHYRGRFIFVASCISTEVRSLRDRPLHASI